MGRFIMNAFKIKTTSGKIVSDGFKIHNVDAFSLKLTADGTWTSHKIPGPNSDCIGTVDEVKADHVAHYWRDNVPITNADSYCGIRKHLLHNWNAHRSDIDRIKRAKRSSKDNHRASGNSPPTKRQKTEAATRGAT